MRPWPARTHTHAHAALLGCCVCRHALLVATPGGRAGQRAAVVRRAPADYLLAGRCSGQQQVGQLSSGAPLFLSQLLVHTYVEAS